MNVGENTNETSQMVEKILKQNFANDKENS